MPIVNLLSKFSKEIDFVKEKFTEESYIFKEGNLIILSNIIENDIRKYELYSFINNLIHLGYDILVPEYNYKQYGDMFNILKFQIEKRFSKKFNKQILVYYYKNKLPYIKTSDGLIHKECNSLITHEDDIKHLYCQKCDKFF